MIWRQIQSVVSTYSSRKWLMLVAATGFFFLLFAAIVTSQSGSKAMGSFYFAGYLAGIASFFVASHAKWQFVHYRARLTPGYAWPHGLALGLCLAIMVIGIPVFLAIMFREPLHVIVAYASLLVSTLTWAMHKQSTLLALSAALVFFSATYLPNQSHNIWSAVPLPGAWCLTLICWCSLAWWLRRLTQMTEEDDDYMIPVAAQVGKLSRVEKSEWRRLVARHVSRDPLMRFIGDPWHDRIDKLPRQTVMQKRSMFRYGFAPTPPIVNLLIVFVTVTAGILSYRIFLASEARPSRIQFFDDPRSWILILFYSSAVGMFPVQFLAARRPRMEWELLLPLARRDFVQGVIRAILHETLLTWTGALFICFAVLWYCCPQSISAERLAIFSTASFSAATLIFNCGLSISLLESGWTRSLLLFPTMLVGFLVTSGIYYLGLIVSPAGALALSVLILGISWWQFHRSLQQWLRVELG